MYTSDNTLKKHLIFNLAVTLFLILFGAVYEAFSHGVYSYFMIYAFVIPLLMGVIPYLVMLMKGKYPGKIFLNLWNSAIATLSVGSVFQGVLEIYGTTNSLAVVYPIAGGMLILISVICAVIRSRRAYMRRGVIRYDTAV